ncbi:hypothetical protein VA596_27700 [Amycolatopsis sp., V23-08]|uniref:Uncharacterized protein n=1 Tax=Amycolatopsis heterodermiae TaxID=3110235 RepID=A0ABU5RAT1_9PSEU|nr:hypothetical protein [Amycolatopsis sp., V23-08]MEA5363347.1 hypothetical protein [Amycolatopsis sp., V23-08]
MKSVRAENRAPSNPVTPPAVTPANDVLPANVAPAKSAPVRKRVPRKNAWYSNRDRSKVTEPVKATSSNRVLPRNRVPRNTASRTSQPRRSASTRSWDSARRSMPGQNPGEPGRRCEASSRHSPAAYQWPRSSATASSTQAWRSTGSAWARSANSRSGPMSSSGSSRTSTDPGGAGTTSAQPLSRRDRTHAMIPPPTSETVMSTGNGMIVDISPV